ncbi:MAG TPA: DUF3105 domain-containing protein [Myxococcota bacterium]|nr:DUF3105 domain-containing protein [Myxococcota bacterium]
MSLRILQGWVLGSALTLSTLAGCPDDTIDTGDTGDTAGETTNPDRPDPLPTCDSTPRTPGTCAIGAVENLASRGAQHINVPTPLSYEDDPPSSGNHRPFWAKWGEYDYLAPQVWLHNLEHGGIAFLYDPCAPSELVDALRVFAQSQPEDDGGAFRWILTPYPDLPTPVAAVAWTWTWQAECVDVESLEDFVVEHYRQAPEDLDWDGSYGAGWLGR